MSGDRPSASVVIPTRDRPDQLGRCLEAIDAQTVPPLEIVVVDDASTDPAALDSVLEARTARVVPNLASRTRVGGEEAVVGVEVRLVRATGAGPAAARNLGAQHARGDVVCFTDDDCRPGPGWVAALLGRIDEGAVAVAGPTVNGRPDDPWAAASQAVTNQFAAASRRPGHRGAPFAPTSNLAVRAGVMAEVPFDETFPLAAGEDREWCDRLAAAGHDLDFEPGAPVLHHQQLGPSGFWRQQVRYGRGAHHLRRRRAAAARQPVRFYLDLVREGFRHGPVVGALVVASQVAVAAGLVTEKIRTSRPPSRD